MLSIILLTHQVKWQNDDLYFYYGVSATKSGRTLEFELIHNNWWFGVDGLRFNNSCVCLQAYLGLKDLT